MRVLAKGRKNIDFFAYRVLSKITELLKTLGTPHLSILSFKGSADSDYSWLVNVYNLYWELSCGTAKSNIFQELTTTARSGEKKSKLRHSVKNFGRQKRNNAKKIARKAKFFQ